LFGVLIVAFAVTVFFRGGIWHDDVSLWSDASAKTPFECRQGWSRSRINLAKAYMELAENDVDSARNLARARGLYGDVAERRPELGYAWYGLAVVALKNGEYDEAQRNLTRATKLRPGDYRMWQQLGVALIAKKDYPGARQALEKASSLNPAHEPSRINLALTYLLEGDYVNAERVIGRIEQTELEQYAGARAIRMAIDLKKGKPVSRDPKNLARSAMYLDNMDLYSDEARVLKVLYVDNTIDADMLYKLAMIKIVKLNEEEEGMRYLSDGVSRFPNDLRFIGTLANAHERRGETDEAVELLKQVIRRYPNHPDAAAIRAHIEALEKGR
jgi:Flp pilus assembly protein TadD